MKKQIFIDANPAELIAWLRGEPVKVAAPPPPPSRPTKKFILTAMSRDVLIIPPALWPEAKS